MHAACGLCLRPLTTRPPFAHHPLQRELCPNPLNHRVHPATHPHIGREQQTQGDMPKHPHIGGGLILSSNVCGAPRCPPAGSRPPRGPRMTVNLPFPRAVSPPYPRVCPCGVYRLPSRDKRATRGHGWGVARGKGRCHPPCGPGASSETGTVRGLRWRNLPRERKGV